MNNFLQSIHDCLSKEDFKSSLTDRKSLWLVYGNEACDLDSVVSALAYSFHKQKDLGETHLVVPVCNIARDKLSLKADVLCWLPQCGIDPQLLVCKDLEQLQEAISVALDCEHIHTTLVDHNWPCQPDQWMIPTIREIIDHHSQELGDGPETLRAQCWMTTIKVGVGSCSSLVAEKCAEMIEREEIGAEMAKVLYGAILTDTVCFSELADRYRQKDVDMAAMLEHRMGITDDNRKSIRQEYFDSIQKAKHQERSCVYDYLAADVKSDNCKQTKWAVSSVLQDHERLMALDDYNRDVKRFIEEESVQLYIINCATSGKRCLLMYSDNEDLLDQLVKYLVAQSSSSPETLMISVGMRAVVVAPNNTRKWLLPHLSAFFTSSWDSNQNNNLSPLECSGRVDTPSNSYDVTPGDVGGTAEEVGVYCEEVEARDRERKLGDNLLSSLVNNKRTLALVERKREALSFDGDEETGEGQEVMITRGTPPTEPAGTTYTPDNSCSDSEEPSDSYPSSSGSKDRALPSLNNRQTLERVREKRRKHRAGLHQGAEERRGSGETASSSDEEDEGCDGKGATGRSNRGEEESSTFTPTNSYSEDTPDVMQLHRKASTVEDPNSQGENSLEERVRRKRELLWPGENGAVEGAVGAGSLEEAASRAAERALRGALQSTLRDRLFCSTREEEGVVQEIVKEAVLKGWERYLGQVDWRACSNQASKEVCEEPTVRLQRLADQVMNEMLETDYLAQHASGVSMHDTATEGPQYLVSQAHTVEASGFNLFRRLSGDTGRPMSESDVRLLGTLHNQHLMREQKDNSTASDSIADLKTDVEMVTESWQESDANRKKLYPRRPILFDSENLDLNMSSADISLNDLDGMTTPDVDDLPSPDLDEYFNENGVNIAELKEDPPSNDLMVRGPSGTHWWKVEPPPATPVDSLMPGHPNSQGDTLPEYTRTEETEDANRYRNIIVSGYSRKVDMLEIEQYTRVLSHGGFYADGDNQGQQTAIIVFSACYLPHNTLHNYHHIMESLFLFLMHKLETMSSEDYTVVYFHGGAVRNQRPPISWLRMCYQMIDYNLKKNLKHLYLVHPNFWLKSVVMLSRFMISSKFFSKIQYINSLRQMASFIPTQFLTIPSHVLLFHLMAALERLRVLHIFKKLHRTCRMVFNEDTTALAAARVRVNIGFTDNRNVEDPEKLEELVKLAEDAEEYLRKCIVQTVCDEDGKKQVIRLREGLAYQDNVPYKGPSEPPSSS